MPLANSLTHDRVEYKKKSGKADAAGFTEMAYNGRTTEIGRR